MKPVAFAIGAHPDDIEFRKAGTLRLLQQAGWEIHYLNIANGCCGSTRHPAATLRQMRAAEDVAPRKFWARISIRVFATTWRLPMT